MRRACQGIECPARCDAPTFFMFRTISPPRRLRRCDWCQRHFYIVTPPSRTSISRRVLRSDVPTAL